MIVSSGKYRGRKLADNKFNHIRPTADIVKQAIFNKLSCQIQDARVLDLFCGTGALGIEAISRGAKEVIFADKDHRSLALTKQNLSSLGITAKTLRGDYKEVLKQLGGKQFDVILIDPPYMSGVYEDALDLIKKYNLLADEGIIVCEHEKSVDIQTTHFTLADQKRYGIKMVSYYTK